MRAARLSTYRSYSGSSMMNDTNNCEFVLKRIDAKAMETLTPIREAILRDNKTHHIFLPFELVDDSELKDMLDTDKPPHAKVPIEKYRTFPKTELV